MKLKLLIIGILGTIIIGCGGGSSSETSQPEVVEEIETLPKTESFDINESVTKGTNVGKVTIPTKTNDAIKTVTLSGTNANKFSVSKDGFIRTNSILKTQKILSSTSQKSERRENKYALKIIIVYNSGKQVIINIEITVYSYVEVKNETIISDTITPIRSALTVKTSPIGTLSWPLCGQINKNKPADWTLGDNCPSTRFGGAEFSDFPISSTFGPRQLVSENNRYDFHRGLDIPTVTGTPVFAIADATVYKSGTKVTGYDDPMVMLRHFRSGYTGDKCGESGGCLHSVYLHLSSVLVQAGTKISQGDLIGYSGASASGFEHLHFEIREANASDPYSSWQRDTVHPLKYLNYTAQDKNNISVKIDSVEAINGTLKVATTIKVPIAELDLMRVEVEVYKKESNGTLTLKEQSSNTVNKKGYYVKPSWFDMDIWNQQYTHKNSSNFSWESFGLGGENACPYASEHPASYTAHNHLDQALDSNSKIGIFNGVSIAQEHYNANSSASIAKYTFSNIEGIEEINQSCIYVKAIDVQGNETVKTYNCTTTDVISAFISVSLAGTPKTSTNIYDAYRFLPTVTDVNNATLTYSIQNQPSWAEFNTITGLLAGHPNSSDGGSYTNIIISVNDGTETVNLAPFDIEVNPAIDIAHKYGKATQGTDSSYSYYYPASNAIDNNDSTYHHTRGGQNGENWLQIELPNPSKISKIVIQNDAGNSVRLTNAKVYVLDTPYVGNVDVNDAVKTLEITTNEQIINFDTPKSGRYVLIKAETTSNDNRHLHLSKVEVYGALPNAPIFNNIAGDYFVAESSTNGTLVRTVEAKDFQGDSLDYSIVGNVPFTIDNNGNIMVNGVLDYGDYTFDVVASDGINSSITSVTINANTDGEAENIARKFGKATQGDVWDNRVANNAIDGDKNTYNHANDVVPNNWWQVEIPRGTKIEKIVIHNSTYLPARLQNAKMYINDETHSIGSTNMGTLDKTLSDDMTQTFTYDPPVSANYVLMQGNLLTTASLSLHMGEVEIYGITPATPAFENKNAFNISIDKWHNKTESIFNAKAIDYQNDTITYSLDGAVPFSINQEGNITVSNFLTLGDYTFDIVITDGVNTTKKPITVSVVTTPIVKTPFRTNDNQPQLSGYLPNTYNEGDSVTVGINGTSYIATINNGMWEIDDDSISPALDIGTHDVTLTINGTAISYANYFEVYGERMQSSKHTLVMNTIADVDVTVNNFVVTPLIKDERVRGSSIRLYVENGVTKLQNKSYRKFASLLGKYTDGNGDIVFVKLNFADNIKPYSDNNLTSFAHDNNMSIVITANHFNGEFSFGGADCSTATNDTTIYCTPTSVNDIIYSDTAVPNDTYSEQQLYSMSLATYNHYFNSIDGLKMMKAWVYKETYKNMDFSDPYQGIDSYIGSEDKNAYLYRHFYNLTMPEHHVSMIMMRYKYAAQGMASLTGVIPLIGNRTSSGWASIWEGTLLLDGGDYETILHEISHAYSNNHETGMSYGWPHAFMKVFTTLYTRKELPIVNVPKYIFETKKLSDTQTKITVHKTVEANEGEMTFELLSSEPLIGNDFAITPTSEENSVILTSNGRTSTRIYIRVYGDDSRELMSKALIF